MLNKKLIFTLLLSLLVLSGCSSSKKGFAPQEWAGITDEGDFLDKAEFNSAVHHIEKLRRNNNEIPHLKKVGVLSFSIYQPGAKTRKTGIFLITPYVTPSGQKFLVDSLYNPALPEMKKNFAAQNIQLLTPAEYLDTDEKKAKFEAAVFENSSMMSLTVSMAKFFTQASSADMKTSPADLKYIMLPNDIPIWRKAGELAGELGLDAFLLVENTMRFDGTNMMLQKIRMALAGPNTVPYRESDSNYYVPFGPLKGYLEGISYGDLDAMAPQGELVLGIKQADDSMKFYFSGMDNIYGRLSRALIKKTQAEIEDIKK